MDPAQALHLTALQKLVRRGSVATLGLAQAGWTSQHLNVLNLLDLPADRFHACAPLEWLGQGGTAQSGSWLKAGFVHLELGRSSARLQRIANLDPDESAALVDTLQSNLRFAGVDVLSSPDSRQSTQFFLHSAGRIDADCFPADFGDVTELRDVLPQGREGPKLRRLLTEAQMLLHDHPVNVRREARGLRPVNAIWLSGLGEFAGVRPASLPRILSNDNYLQGLCRLHGHGAQAIPDSASAVLSGDAPVLIELSLQESAQSARELLALEHTWIAPLVAAIGAKRLPAARLLLDQHLVWIDRSGLRRFWRRGPALARLLS